MKLRCFVTNSYVHVSVSDLYTAKNAVELLDVPSRNNSLMMKKYNSHVEILFLYTHVLLFQLCYRMRKFDIRTV
jgi:hypothetical protein